MLQGHGMMDHKTQQKAFGAMRSNNKKCIMCTVYTQCFSVASRLCFWAVVKKEYMTMVNCLSPNYLMVKWGGKSWA